MGEKRSLVHVESLDRLIYEFRGQRVMLDRDLARLYGVATKNLNKAVRRNSDRFPHDFMFQLTREESNSSRFQFGTLKRGQNIKYRPYAFTEHGVAMLSSVLRSKRAAQVNVLIYADETGTHDVTGKLAGSAVAGIAGYLGWPDDWAGSPHRCTRSPHSPAFPRDLTGEGESHQEERGRGDRPLPV